jgi:hypothetical protein
MDAIEVQKRILDRYGIRVEPAMSDYVLRKLTQSTTPRKASSFPVMGGDARTGIPVRQLISPHELSDSVPETLFPS